MRREIGSAALGRSERQVNRPGRCAKGGEWASGLGEPKLKFIGAGNCGSLLGGARLTGAGKLGFAVCGRGGCGLGGSGAG